ncbi:MAG: hypothetical protein ACI8WB_004418 [Phenylobacterium sp.]|jgi:hypothetical protein
MQDGFPIVIKVHPQLLAANPQLAGVAAKVEAWLNFAALSALWYGDESCVLEFEFTLVTTKIFSQDEQYQGVNWTASGDDFFSHDTGKTVALIVLNASYLNHFEQALKAALLGLANLVVKDYGFEPIAL